MEELTGFRTKTFKPNEANAELKFIVHVYAISNPEKEDSSTVVVIIHIHVTRSGVIL